ncbi:MAG: ribonuclease P protein component [Bryobacteraceae bacterium]
MSGPSAGPSKPIVQPKHRFAFPKSARLRRRKDFRRVLDQGFRVAGPYFVAFCCWRQDEGRPRVGFSAPRSLGKAVVRNRIKRRLREAVRLNLEKLAPGWDVVITARPGAADAPFEQLLKAVEELFARCRG